jgi:hypothetical protein
MATHTGRCQCGDITYEISADPIFSGHCSCIDCQKASGTGHSTIVAFPKAALKVSGAPTKYASKGDSGKTVTRHFCPRCGSRLFSEGEGNPVMILVSAASLDDQSIVKPGAHVYAKSKAPWDHVNPALPSFPMMPPGM